MRYSRLFLAMMARARRRVPEPELEELELQGGVKVKLPKDEAEKYRTARSKDKEERDGLAKIAGEAKREKEAAEKAKAEADRQVELEKAMKKEDLKKVRELANEESVQKLARREKRVITEHLRAKISQLYPKVDSDTLEDTIALNAPKFRLNAETDEIEAVDAAGQLLTDSKTGKPLTADAVLEAFAKTRSHLQKARTPAGDGDVGTMRGDSTITHTLTERQVQKLMETGKWRGSEYERAQKAKTLRIIDD
jgi:hypothetical protein